MTVSYPCRGEKYNVIKANFDRRIASFEAHLSRAHIRFRMVSYERSLAVQAAIYAQGRTSPGSIVSNAKPGQSPHNWGLARDYVLFANGKVIQSASHPAFKVFAMLAATYALVTGRDFKGLCDAGHVQHPAWRKAITWKPGK